MRTIKFKAKAIKDGSWTFCDLFHALNDICINSEHGFKRQQRYLTVVAPHTVCQFTGFQDLAGHDIYEGDILVSHTFPFYFYSHSNDKLNPNYVGIVSWNEHLACFELKMRKNYSIQGKDTYGNELIKFNKISAINYEVIGSIHDLKWQEKLNLKDE